MEQAAAEVNLKFTYSLNIDWLDVFLEKRKCGLNYNKCTNKALEIGVQIKLLNTHKIVVE